VCVYDGECRGQVDGEMGIEADRVDVEERNECGACVIRQLGEDVWADGCGRDDEGIWPQSVWVRKPGLDGLVWLVEDVRRDQRSVHTSVMK